MTQYRKKPIIIEAIQLKDNQKSIYEVTTFINGAKPDTSSCMMASDYWDSYLDLCKKSGGIRLKTLESDNETQIASFGDWIIKGVNGEFYPCKPDIFEKTYEIV
jgi:hypothetical protein